MGVAAWSVIDEGYLRAYQWAGALAAGTPLPQEATSVPLGPGEVAHITLPATAVSGYFGEAKPYNRSFLLVGGPVGLAVTGAASIARNASKKAEAERAAVPRWHMLGTADLVATNQRMLASAATGQSESFWYAQTSPVELTQGAGGLAGVLEREPAAGDQVLHRLGNKHLRCLGERGDPGPRADGQAGALPFDELALARMDAGPDLDPQLAHPIADLVRAVDGAGGAVEGRVEAVSRCVVLVAAPVVEA